MSKLEAAYELISDKTKNPVTTTEYIKHGSDWLDTKINQISTSTGTKAEKSYVDTELAKKADKTAVSSLETTVNGKADSSTVSALSTRMGTAETNIATQTARIDAIAALPSGSTSGDAELQDIRVGANGTTYADAGTAVRSQITDVKSDLGSKENLNTDNKTNIVNAINEVNNRFIEPVVDAVENWLDEHPEATTTVQDGSITENKINQCLVKGRMPFKYIYSETVSLNNGDYVYDKCIIESINSETDLSGSHLFKNCTIGTLVIRGGTYKFLNCTFEEIRIVSSKAIFSGCTGNSIILTGKCDNSIIDSCKLTAETNAPIIVNGSIADGVKISNNTLVNKKSETLIGIQAQCINTHGISNSIIENNYCETDTDRSSIDISGHSSDNTIRSFNNVIRNNYLVNGGIVVYATKNAIIDGNYCNEIYINGEYEDLDYGYLHIKNNTILSKTKFRTQRGNPTQNIIISGNTILGDVGIETYYEIPDGVSITFANNTLNGPAIKSNEYAKKVNLPKEMIYIQGGQTTYLPFCYVVKSELSSVIPTDSYFNGGSVTNDTSVDRYIIYSKININRGQTRLWNQ